MIVKPQDHEQHGRPHAGPMAQLAALHLDRQFDAADWAVLHDLRLPLGARMLHVDHLLINDFLECLCIDSRYLTRTLAPSPEGGFRLRAEGVEAATDGSKGLRVGSPLGKAAREARLMAGLVDQRRTPRGGAAARLTRRWADRVARRLPGPSRHRSPLGPRISVRSLVLHDPSRLDRAERHALSSCDQLAGTEALYALLQDQRRRRHQQPFARVPPTRLYALARALAARHRGPDAPGGVDSSVDTAYRSTSGDGEHAATTSVSVAF